MKSSVIVATGAMLLASQAAAQVPFPTGWANGPQGKYRQTVFPYPGQCWTDTPIDGLPQCTLNNARSFACEPGGSGLSNQSAGPLGKCGKVTRPTVLAALDPAAQKKFQFEVLNPPDYTPDTKKVPGADYYEIAVHEAWGFQVLASAGLFPDPTKFAGTPVPNGAQWTGLVCPPGSINCTPGKPIVTPVWGVGQKNLPKSAPLGGVLNLATPGNRPEWSANNFVATWPSISIRGTIGRPVLVKWVNEFPNNHLFCPHPEAADWPCAIDRTFMGVKATIDAQKAPFTFQPAGVPYYGVNQFGSPMQPDNSWVTHLHGGEIPPGSDGFAEKWFGNARTGLIYSPLPWPLDPAFGAPYEAIKDGSVGVLVRPGGPPGFNPDTSWMYDTFEYPMVQNESTIWFHDHTLGKTHHNVVAGPAGFFPIRDPSKHNPQTDGACSVKNDPSACEYTWLDPVTEPRDNLTIPKYDLFLAVQDRSFNDDGSINFPNGLDQPVIPPAKPGDPNYPACLSGLLANGKPGPLCSPPGTTTFTPGVNPQVHPQWVPEYFNDHVLVNGVIWPKKTVAAGYYRVRLVNGSDARCYHVGLSTKEPVYATDKTPGSVPPSDVKFTLIATEQGYLKKPLTDQSQFVMCPGERYELLVDFSPYVGKSIFVTNDAPAPYPGGTSPLIANGPFSHTTSIMRFDVSNTAGVPACGNLGTTWPNPKDGVGCIKVPAVNDVDFVDVTGLPNCPAKGGAVDLAFNGGNCIAAERQLYLNEVIDPVTMQSMGLQINGVPFEYDVTETPKAGTWERWKIVNTTVDAHPIHPHLAKFQIVSRQNYDIGGYLTALCGSPTCNTGPAPGGVPRVTPDVTPYLFGPAVGPKPSEAGWKDAMVAYPQDGVSPGGVLTFVGKWDGGWRGAHGECAVDNRACFEPVTSGPYVWHCHINSHEDSEMMRTSLVVK